MIENLQRAASLHVGKSSIFSFEEDQRSTGFVPMKPNHAAKQDRVVACLMNFLAQAFKHGECIGKRGRSQLCGFECNAIETVFTLSCKARGDAFVRRSEYADCVTVGRRKRAKTVRVAVDTPKNERRI